MLLMGLCWGITILVHNKVFQLANMTRTVFGAIMDRGWWMGSCMFFHALCRIRGEFDGNLYDGWVSPGTNVLT